MPDPKTLTESRMQLHYASQFMAATGMALGQPQPDGSQMTFAWDAEMRGFIGDLVPGGQPCYLALDPVTLTSLILDGQRQAIATLPLIGQTMTAALDWHKAQLTQLGIATHKIEFLSYPEDFPDHPLAHGAVFAPGSQAARQTIAAYFAATQPLLQGIVTSQAGASPIHIWPHHFDMATLITLSGSGASAHTIGVGLSPGDGGYDQPYWYVTPWPYPDPAILPSLAVGTWHTTGWVGAILLADTLGDPASETAQQTVQTFLQEAVQAGLKLMP